MAARLAARPDRPMVAIGKIMTSDYSTFERTIDGEVALPVGQAATRWRFRCSSFVN
jgi:hypothetical protein